MDKTEDRFEIWAKVELMGHQWIAGKVTEESRFGTVLMRVDVPDEKGRTKFTRYFGGSSIYSINPVTPDIAIALAQNASAEPVHAYQLPNYLPARNPEAD